MTALNEKIKKQILQYELGCIRESPEHLRIKTLSENRAFCTGKAIFKKLSFIATVNGTEYSFPAFAVIPSASKCAPVLVYVTEEEPILGMTVPIEEIIDRGFAFIAVPYYGIVSKDRKPTGLERALTGKRKTLNSPSKSANAIWALMRIMDYISASADFDETHAAIVGNSRLGRLAMLCGAFDERFKYVIASGFATEDSGANGACVDAAFHFSKNYARRALKCLPLPYDVKISAALIPPRMLIISSAENDIFSSCDTERETALYAMRECEKYPNAVCENSVSYFTRSGMQGISREEWNFFIDKICQSKNE